MSEDTIATAATNRPSGGECLLTSEGGIYPGWKTAIGSMLCLTVGPSVICSMCFGIYVPYMRESFGWTVPEINRAVSLLGLAILMTSVISGLLIDRLGVRPMVLVSIPLLGIAYFLMSFQSGELWQFYLGWFLLPWAGIGLWPGAWAKATAEWFDRRLGFAVAVATLGVGLGAAVVPQLINHIASADRWQSAFQVVGVASALIAWPISYFMVHEAPKRKRGAAFRASPPSWTDQLRDYRLHLVAGAFLVLGAFSAVIVSNLISLLEANGMTRTEAVAALSVIGIATIIGRLLCGWLIDRFPFRLVVPTYCLASAVAVALLASGASGIAAFACAAVIGMMIGAEIDLLGFIIKRLFAIERYATLYGGIFAAFHLGGVIFAIVFGQLYAATSSYVAGLILASMACLFAATLFIFLPMPTEHTS